ncbi:hypothetical protein [Microcoleus sp. herbarium14]|uniref:hypothetical protein n=1 Tax=Microcoleus sp. herbarium14 TaxID=3055439 RepID=UPI002FCEEA1D
MKKQSILGIILSCAVLGACYLTKPQTVNAAPASIFTPILRDIKNQIPRGWVMHLQVLMSATLNFTRKSLQTAPESLRSGLIHGPTVWIDPVNLELLQ